MSGAGCTRAVRGFPRSFDSLDGIFEFIERFFADAALPLDHLRPVEFVVEELFTNHVKYAAGNPHEIVVELERKPDHLRVSVTDFDTEPFDVRQAPDARTDLPIDQRRPGGLGIHILKRMVDGLDYEYVNRRSKTTFTKVLR